MIRLRM